ncbi:GNAT family N-acetyltransferase [Mesorhizobium sp. WSM3626]|uniref:GNAT family N-acetyltransferase n=1 Tax=Mesorhizobium sp. WSM3626 TaxID=1040987 RepID=UPI001FD87CC4|nr:GNAT family N-acetyltransferase [Mesorhizobium sp. WSM3626]
MPDVENPRLGRAKARLGSSQGGLFAFVAPRWLLLYPNARLPGSWRHWSGTGSRMQIERYDGDREALLPLFALADDSHTQISRYVEQGEVLVAREGGEIVGHAQIIDTGDTGAFELKSIAVTQARQGEGLGRLLVAAAITRCRERGGQRLIVSTASCDIGNLRFYQLYGFRMSRIVRDAFGLSTGYPEGMLVDGITLRDQVVFEYDLSAD